jgi:hypothetical protein
MRRKTKETESESGREEIKVPEHMRSEEEVINASATAICIIAVNSKADFLYSFQTCLTDIVSITLFGQFHFDYG